MKVECIECGGVKIVTVARGRPRFFDTDRCRLIAYRKVKKDPALRSHYEEKREAIRKLYQEERRSTRSLPGLRRRAMQDLFKNDWTEGNIGRVFGISKKRVQQLLE